VKVVGLCGYGGTGKDEVGRLLVENHLYVRWAKGDLLKQAAYRMSPLVKLGQPDDVVDVESLAHLADRMSDGTVIERIDVVKTAYPAVRRFLQDLADEVAGVCGTDVWNDALWRSMREWAHGGSYIEGRWPRIVLTRLSLPQEADRLKGEGGRLVRVTRPGYGPANDHPNEVALDDYPADAVIVNDGTLEALAVKVALLEDSLW
jgi:hypothetical protein